MSRSTSTDAPITRDDLERRFAALQGGLKAKVESREGTVKTLLGVGAVLLVLIVFGLGRRSGRRKTPVVEIRRL
jgi:hypothetical protein